MLRLLPPHYAVRNLLRRPARTALTLAALTTLVLVVLAVVGFIRGLDRSLSVSADPQVVLLHARGVEASLENSAIAASSAGLVAASLEGVQRRYGVPHVSPELYLATRVLVGDRQASKLGLVRGVTDVAPLVRRQVRLIEGDWPGPGELIVGRLAAAKLGCDPSHLSVGSTVVIEGRPWVVRGRFAADQSALEAEIWCRLDDFQAALQRQDLSLVAVLLSAGASFAEVDQFCWERRDLQLEATRESDYYGAIERHYGPVRTLGWTVVLLVSAAGVLTGLNLMYGAVAGRTRELATLQAIGYRRRAVMLSVVQEGALLATVASLLAAALALALLNGAAVRFTMGAFALHLDAVALAIGCGTGLAVGVAGSIPPAIRALRVPVSESLKAV